MSRTQLTGLQWLIVLAHVALALIYGAINPPWEAHDETGHFNYVNYLVVARSLPDASATDKALFDQSHQPPLYYLMTAALTSWAERNDDVEPEFNNFALDGSNRRGFRIMLRQPEEAFPWQGTILALHAARAVSALLTGLTVYLIAASANLLFSSGSIAALLSTAIAAFNPQVIFMGAMVNNDAMVAAMGAWVGYSALRIARGGTRNADYLLFGLALGLAFLSKNSALALIGFAAVAMALVAWRQGWPVRILLRRSALTFATCAAVALPYLGYNLTRYGRLLVDRNPNNPILTAPTSVIGEGVLVSIRDYHRMYHLRKVLEKTNLRRHDIVVMTVRPIQAGAAEYELTDSQLFSDYERELFSHVVSLAEKQGKHVELLVVPGVDPFDAMVQTAARLQASRLVTGVSERMTSEELAVRIGRAWERLPEPRHPFSLEIISPGRASSYVNLGHHPPRLWPEDLDLLHKLWLRLSGDERLGSRLHHRDVVGVALRRLERDLEGERGAEVMEEMRREIRKD